MATCNFESIINQIKGGEREGKRDRAKHERDRRLLEQLLLLQKQLRALQKEIHDFNGRLSVWAGCISLATDDQVISVRTKRLIKIAVEAALAISDHTRDMTCQIENMLHRIQQYSEEGQGAEL